MTTTEDIRTAFPALGWVPVSAVAAGAMSSGVPSCSDKSLTVADAARTLDDMQEFDAMMKPEDAAKFIGVHPKTLSRWRIAGVGGPPWVRLSERIIRYRASDLSAWLNAKAAE